MLVDDQHLMWATAGAVLLLALVAGLLTRGLVLGRLARIAAHTASRRDDVVIASLRQTILTWFAILGVFAAVQLVPIPAEARAWSEKALLCALVLSVTLWAARLVANLMGREPPPGTAELLPATGVVRQTTRILVVVVGGLVLLSTLGISIAPVLTTLGIGGLAVALGLQETLTNLFAGMQLTLAGNIRIGDFIRLESGEEGFIDDIQWRATRVRTLANNFVLIPNSRLAQSVVTNYHRPSKDVAVLVQVGVHYDSDLARVERVTCEVARNVMQTVPGGVPDFEPFIRFHTFADSSINFTVILRTLEFSGNFLIKHEFIKALSTRYSAEGIVIPFPIRALNFEQERVHGPNGGRPLNDGRG